MKGTLSRWLERLISKIKFRRTNLVQVDNSYLAILCSKHSSRESRWSRLMLGALLKRFRGTLTVIQGRLIVLGGRGWTARDIRSGASGFEVLGSRTAPAHPTWRQSLSYRFEIVPGQWIVSRPRYVAITLGGTVCRYCPPPVPSSLYVDLTVLHRPKQTKVYYAR